jgi:hypothetical protein
VLGFNEKMVKDVQRCVLGHDPEGGMRHNDWRLLLSVWRTTLLPAISQHIDNATWSLSLSHCFIVLFYTPLSTKKDIDILRFEVVALLYMLAILSRSGIKAMNHYVHDMCIHAVNQFYEIAFPCGSTESGEHYFAEMRQNTNGPSKRRKFEGVLPIILNSQL